MGAAFTQLSGEFSDESVLLLRQALNDVMARIVDIAIACHVDVVTIAGDLFDQADPPVTAQFAVSRQFRRLSEAGIPVVMTCGNHDPVGFTPLVPWPASVHVLGLHPSQSFVEDVLLPIGGQLVQFSGFSYRVSELYGSQVALFHRRKEANVAIALYHGQVGLATTRHAPYAATSVASMTEGEPFDVWALGHIHTPQILCEDKPLILYPGTPQGRDKSEIGPRGVYLIDVHSDGTSQVEFCRTSAVEWCRLTIDVSGCFDIQEIMDAVVDGIDSVQAEIPLFVDLNLLGQTPLYRQLDASETVSLIREYVASTGREAWIYRYECLCEPEIDWAVWANTDGYVAELLHMLDDWSVDPAGVSERLLTDVPEADQAQIREALAAGPDALASILAKARHALLAAMRVEGSSSTI